MQPRPLPPPPGLWIDSAVAQVPVRRAPSRVPPPPPLPYHSFTAASSSFLSLVVPPSSVPPPPSDTTISPSSPTRSRAPSLHGAKGRSFRFSISKATRNATAWFAEHAARKDAAEAMFEDVRRVAVESEAAAIAAKIRSQEDSHKAVIQAKANEAVKLSIQSLLSHGLPNECDIVLRKCDKICREGGLDLSTVLQEPLLDGKPPVYWAILNGSSTTSNPALHALVLSLLNTCQPLKDNTITSIRLACMMTSNNTLLQHLFWHFPALSPLSPGDTILLSSAGGGDVITVDETQGDAGSFVARIQIRRFRLRMRVSKLIKVEFVTSDRIWTVIISVGANGNTEVGRSGTPWLLSFGLGHHSTPAWVDGDFLVLRRLPSVGRVGGFESTFSLPLGSNPCKLQPGLESAIKIRLDDGPMRPHLLNESLSLVDRDGTLHAQFNVRLTQIRAPPPIPPSIDFSDRSSMRSSTQKSTRSRRARSVIFNTKEKRNRDGPKEKKVYTSLRRGGR